MALLSKTAVTTFWATFGLKFGHFLLQDMVTLVLAYFTADLVWTRNK